MPEKEPSKKGVALFRFFVRLFAVLVFSIASGAFLPALFEKTRTCSTF